MRRSPRVSGAFVRCIGCAALVACIVSLACSGGQNVPAYCVFESGSLSPGRCLTECESRCRLTQQAGCGPSGDCSKVCPSPALTVSPCAAAEYAHWRCLRRAGEPRVTCTPGGPRLTTSPGLCSAEQAAMDAACCARDAGSDACGDGASGAARDAGTDARRDAR